MDQTLNRISESLAFLLDQRDIGGGEVEGEGGGRLRRRLGRTCHVLPSQDSLPSYDQLSSSPSSFSSNTASAAACPNPALNTTTASQDESCWNLKPCPAVCPSVYLSVHLSVCLVVCQLNVDKLAFLIKAINADRCMWLIDVSKYPSICLINATNIDW